MAGQQHKRALEHSPTAISNWTRGRANSSKLKFTMRSKRGSPLCETRNQLHASPVIQLLILPSDFPFLTHRKKSPLLAVCAVLSVGRAAEQVPSMKQDSVITSLPF